MKRILRALAVGAVALVVAGCEPLTPRVECEPRLLSQSVTVAAAGGVCPFPDALEFRSSVSPRPAGSGDAGVDERAYQLAGAEVIVAGASGAIAVCAGLDCSPNGPEVKTRISSDGLLRWVAAVNLPALGLPAVGQTLVHEGTAVTETYGAGNSCHVPMKLTLHCTP